MSLSLFAILQKYDFSSKSQPQLQPSGLVMCCLRYCKSTIFQANHNHWKGIRYVWRVVCDTAKVRFFKQITTSPSAVKLPPALFAILQKYDFSSKSQQVYCERCRLHSCLRYCKSTIFQANHNFDSQYPAAELVVCDTAKVRFFKQITTRHGRLSVNNCCLRYCKSTIFQANHNKNDDIPIRFLVVCDTAKVRFFKQITTMRVDNPYSWSCLWYCKSTIFQANHNLACCWYLLKLSWLLMVL